MQTCIEYATTNRIFPNTIQLSKPESHPLANIIALLKRAQEVERKPKLTAASLGRQTK